MPSQEKLSPHRLLFHEMQLAWSSMQARDHPSQMKNMWPEKPKLRLSRHFIFGVILHFRNIYILLSDLIYVVHVLSFDDFSKIKQYQ